MKNKQLMALGLALSLSVITFTGCGVKTDTPIIGNVLGLKSNEIFKVDKVTCTKAEFKLLLMDSENQYKKTMGSNLDWNGQITKDKTLKQYIMEKVKEDSSVKYAMAAFAKSQNITLTDEEKTNINQAANKYFTELTDEEKKYTGAKLKDIETVYETYYLANKGYNEITKDIGLEVSDEEARVIKIQYIRMNSSKTSEKKIKSTFKEVTGLVNGGYQEFAREAKQFSEDEVISKTIKKNEAKEDYEISAFNLNKKEISKTISSGDNYYLVYCVDSYNKEETATNKSKIVSEQKNTYYKDLYNNYIADTSSDFNTGEWEDIEFSNDTNVKADNLMTIFNTIK